MPAFVPPATGWRHLVVGAAIALLPALSPGQLFAAGPQVATADQALPLGQQVSGHLEAGSSGQFAYYSFVYPGDQSTVTIDLEIRPDDPALLPLAGFNVYGPRPGQLYVSGGAQTGLDPDVAGNVISADQGTYIVQVYNYNPQTPIDFKVWIEGMPVQPAAAPAPAAPSPTAAPSASQVAGVLDGSTTLQGQLDAGAAGHVALYRIAYPGDGSVYTINLQITPDDPTLLQNAGFRVYGPRADKLYVTGGDQSGLLPNVSANLISTDAGTYTVEVYNYDPQRSVSYQLSLVAAPPPPSD